MRISMLALSPCCAETITTATIGRFPSPASRPRTVCMACCSVLVSRLRWRSFPYQLNEEAQNEVVDFVLEAGGTKPDYARQLFDRFKTDPLADPVLRSMLGKLDFANK